MNNKTFEYKTKLSYTHFITPSIGLFAIYTAITNKSGLAYRGTLIFSYPGSSYFFAFIGVLMLLPLIWLYLKVKKQHFLELTNNELKFTKGIIKTKNISIKYSDIKNITFQEDEDDGSSIIIDSGTFFDSEFYAKKFKSSIDYSNFCEEINSIVNNINKK